MSLRSAEPGGACLALTGVGLLLGGSARPHQSPVGGAARQVLCRKTSLGAAPPLLIRRRGEQETG
jgi:hypothetical protein